MAESSPRGFAALKNRDIRLFVCSVAFFAFAGRALAVVIGFQIYMMTKSALALGWLGLVEAIPAIALAPFGGYVADRFNRRKILLVTRAVSALCAGALALLSLEGTKYALPGIYAMIFTAGIARGFADPAATAFEANIVPRELTVNAASWVSSAFISCSVIGPAAIGFVFDWRGAPFCYALLAACFAAAWVCTVLIKPPRQTPPAQTEPVVKSIKTGWKYLAGDQPLLGAMALDLFAVFFGGTVALLPIYASDILHTGAKGLGLLNAAPSMGALAMTLAATRHPPIRHAGRNLLWSVSGFGLCMIAFAFSRNFALSLAVLFLSGVFDGLSMVIRRSMLRLLSPDALRGRIASASSIFICASNELGAFESGLGAAWLGAVACTAVGGVLTLGVVGAAAYFAPKLRRLQFDSDNRPVQNPLAA